VSVLEWILLLELLVIVVSAIFFLVAKMIAMTTPDDPMYVFMRTFWKTFLYPPVFADPRLEPGFEVRSTEGDEPAVRAPKAIGTDHDDDDDAKYGRVRPGADGVVHTVHLNLNVTPHAESDSLVGRSGDALELQVTAAAEEGAANKAVIQLVADAIGVKPYQVTLTKGHYQTRKAVSITGIDQAQLEMKLEAIGS
jgi:uncharacterized protein (TIGR00251 family)